MGDFNGDGKLDLAAANFYGNKVSVLLNANPSATLTKDFNDIIVKINLTAIA